MKQRVVITGMGVVSPLGNQLQEFCKGLLDGISAAGPITLFDASHLATQIAAEAKIGASALQTSDRKVAFALSAARAAIEDANRNQSLHTHYPTGSGGLSLGVGLELFSMPALVQFLQNDSLDSHSPINKKLDFLQTPSDICIPMICKEHDLLTLPLLHVSACAASTDAIGMAFRLIQNGERSWMLAGGTDSMINPLGVGGFCKLTATTQRNQEPQKASRPFDRDRDGFLMGEGAGILVLESLTEAQKRGAFIYGEVLGYGNSFDAYGISEPHPEALGALLAMEHAIAEAKIHPHEITHVSAHGTGTLKNDPIETLAIRKLLGAHADQITVNSTKSMIGHLISASGAVETIATLLCGNKGWVHPTLNLENPDPACDLDYVVGKPKKLKPGYILKNSFAFGGQNAALVLKVNDIVF